MGCRIRLRKRRRRSADDHGAKHERTEEDVGHIGANSLVLEELGL